MEFQKARDINPHDSDAIHGLAEVQENLGQISEAEASYKRAIAFRPDFWDGYNSLAAFYYDRRRYQDAITQFKRVIELTPEIRQRTKTWVRSIPISTMRNRKPPPKQRFANRLRSRRTMRRMQAWGCCIPVKKNTPRRLQRSSRLWN